MSPLMQRMRRVYEAVARPEKPVWRGGSWRLPNEVVTEHIERPFLSICAAHGVKAKFCKRNLIETV